ncbi:hypothetical protein FRUB_03657 [Fimbriiglobus ruber]|uniref:Uncharacterized protein n=1 Tax=Fimbriiglobus ruber TaxID=1908690 RepID=A0A225DWL7_9BACT|nr:hypothetical protein FRUB_03657 [Fimbriiglobus ruber]
MCGCGRRAERQSCQVVLWAAGERTAGRGSGKFPPDFFGTRLAYYLPNRIRGAL